MSFITNALGGNPFSTLIGQRIEQATDASLPSENWELNMEICDLINSSEAEGARDAIKAIRKRLQQNAGKNYTVVMYTLIVLETCVKNCGRNFHTLACSKDFVQELVKLIGPKYEPPTAVQEKVLSLIQSWADTFADRPELSGVCSVVSDLRSKGIEFPPTDLDTMAPIYTPKVRAVTEPCAEVTVPNTMGAGDVPAAITASLTPEQLAKLQSELDVVQTNMAVLAEMLTELTPGKEEPADLELLQELYAVCQSMQQRLVELIGKLSNDDITAELLRINDEMNNLFLRYTRHWKNREVGTRGPSAVVASALGGVPPKTSNTAKALENQDSLIDLSDDIPDSSAGVVDQFAALSVKDGNATSQLSKISSVPAQKGGLEKDDEFDMFAQSRNVTYETSKLGGSTYKDNLESEQFAGSLASLAANRTQTNVAPREQEFDEMAAWLESTPGNPDSMTEESITSSEFAKFLAERAAAVNVLPSSHNPNTESSTTSPQKQRRKDEDAQLFAL